MASEETPLPEFTEAALQAVRNVLTAEVEWLEEALKNSSEVTYGPEFRNGWATALGWVRFHAEHPDLTLERLMTGDPVTG